MKVAFLQEPELEFGGGGRHIDIRYGLRDYGPLDCTSALAPNEIRVGIVGTPRTVEGIARWLERCRGEIPGKAGKHPGLHPGFPGYRWDTGFRSTLILDSSLQRTIPDRQVDVLAKAQAPNFIVSQAVEAFYSELRYLAQETTAAVLICAPPLNLVEAMNGAPPPIDGKEGEEDQDEEANDEDGNEDNARLDFHHMLKARAMQLPKPTQLVLPTTYDSSVKVAQKNHPGRFRASQDEATRAWNFHTALYYKAGGIPWRLTRDPAALATCYVGICFYQSLDGDTLLTGTAQVFNDRGEGIVVRGGSAKLSKDDRQVHMQGADAYRLLIGALKTYKERHKNLPARIVLHKSSVFNAEESEGFMQAVREMDVESVDLLSVTSSGVRLFRTGAYPPLRGSWFSLDERTHVLYTRGSVEFFTTYPGLYVPRPLLFRCDDTEETPRHLAQETLALSKMNWNNTQFDGGDPITIAAARRVGGILRYVDEGERVEPRYSFYM